MVYKMTTMSGFLTDNWQGGILPLNYFRMAHDQIDNLTFLEYDRNMPLVENLTVKIASEYFCTAREAEGKSPKTIESYVYNLKVFMAYFPDLVLNNITSHHIREFLKHRGENRSDETKHQSYKVLNVFFKWCIKEGLLSSNPMNNVDPPKVDKKVVPTYAYEDFKKLLARCGQSFIGVRNRAMISLLVDVGLRRAELVSLQIKDLDTKKRRITVMGKGRKERKLSIESKSMSNLLRYLIRRDDRLSRMHRSCDYIFMSEECRPLTGSGCYVILRKLCIEAGIKPFKVVHKFRHTFATEKLRNKGDLATLKYDMGHTKISTTERYFSTLLEEDAARDHQTSSPGNKWL